MNRLLAFLMANPVANGLITLLTLSFYGAAIGAALTPALLWLGFSSRWWLPLNGGLSFLMLGLALGIAFYAALISAALLLGLLQRLLTLGFEEGRYPVQSPVVARWLIYSGLHVIMLNAVLPFLAGTCLNRMYYRILGCKLGRNVFINTPGLHDAYLLEIGDNVVIGGKADITCHIFEGDHLILGRIRIGSDTLIGSHTAIQPGVTIGSRCSIGLYSYIRKNRVIPDKTVMMAVPGLPMRHLARLEKLCEPEKGSKPAETANR